MKCKHVRQKIDQFLIEKKGPLTKKASQHISECPPCREHYESTLHASKLIDKLRDSEPRLTEASKLTENIMLGINQLTQENSARITNSFVPSIKLQRLLAAASICLFLIFGYEQYIVLDKITHLEQESQAIGMNSQIENTNLKGTLEGLLLLKFKIKRKDPEILFKNLNFEHYNNQELLAAYSQVKNGNLTSKELKQVLGSNFTFIEASNLIEMIKSYNIESPKSNNIIKY